MVKTKKEIDMLAKQLYTHKYGVFIKKDGNELVHDTAKAAFDSGIKEGYKAGVHDMNQYKKGYDILYDFLDEISEEWCAENPEVIKKLKKIGL